MPQSEHGQGRQNLICHKEKNHPSKSQDREEGENISGEKLHLDEKEENKSD